MKRMLFPAFVVMFCVIFVVGCGLTLKKSCETPEEPVVVIIETSTHTEDDDDSLEESIEKTKSRIEKIRELKR